jgi:hypothetical protein
VSAAESVALNLPAAWFELDPRTPDLVLELSRVIGMPAEAREAAVALLGPIVTAVHSGIPDAEIVLLGGFAEAIEIDPAQDPLVVTASVLLAVSPPLDDPAAAAAGIDQVEPVDLPAGPTVLATGEVEITDPRWEGSVAARTRRYLVPVPGTDRIAVLAFQTPNLDLADQFDDVFAAIAESLAFDTPTPAGDPT